MEDELPTALDTEIDYEKSINKHRLVNKPAGSAIFNYGFDYVLIWVIIVCACYGLVRQVINNNSGNITTCIFLFVIIWLAVNLYFNNLLIKIEGKTVVKNKEDILNTLDVFFSSYNFLINNEKMMRSFKPHGIPIWGRIITILFKDDLIYINITTLGKSDSPTWIHGLFNFIKAKRIARYYRSHLTVSPALSA